VADFSKVGTVHIKIGTVLTEFGEKNQNQPDLIFFNPPNF
jgi:hypothetical protein